MNDKSFIAAGIDLGSSNTRCVLCRMDGLRAHFLGAGTIASKGWHKSRIIDQQAVSACALAAVQQAEAMAGTQIETITVGFGGLTVRGANTRRELKLGRPREIVQ